MSRAIMQAQIEAEQDRAETQWEACMQREADTLAQQQAEEEEWLASRCQLCAKKAMDGDYLCQYHRHINDEYWQTDFRSLAARADYYEGLLVGESDELPF